MLTGLSPNAESANMTTRCKLQKIQLIHTYGVNTRDVAEGPGQALIFVIDNKGACSLDAPTVAHLTLTSTEPLAFVYLWIICP